MKTDWHAAALARDVPPKVVVAAQFDGVELAVWRSASGKLSAWKDRCPHRGMRLSHGFVRGETLSCIYHGWVYGTSGACQHIPAHPDLTPPSAIRADTYDCIEAGGVIWLAPLGTASAPPDLAGLTPVRTMFVNASAAQLSAAVPDLRGDHDLRGSVDMEGAAGELCLLLQRRASGGVAVHLLCADQADRIRASRWLENLRRIAEEGVAA